MQFPSPVGPNPSVPSPEVSSPDSLLWVPVDLSIAGLVFTGVSASYFRIGNGSLIWASCRLTFPVTGSAAGVQIGGLPFTVPNRQDCRGGGMISSAPAGAVVDSVLPVNGSSSVVLVKSGVGVLNSAMSGLTIIFSVLYPTA